MVPLLENSQEDETTHVLIVSHGALLRCLLNTLISPANRRISPLPGKKKLTPLGNTSVTTIEFNHALEGALVSYNDTFHLEEAGVRTEVLASAEDMAMQPNGD